MVRGGVAGGEAAPGRRFFADLHTHSNASFDSLASPASLARSAAERGLTHLAITDHERIDGALAARAAVAELGLPLTVIVGEEIRTADGDLAALFLERPVTPGRPALETIRAVREQGGLIGIPHPYDRFRGSLLRDARLERIVAEVDWIETHNARIAVGNGNVRAAELAHATGKPGIGVSDAHSAFEVGVAYTAFDTDPSTPAGLLAALASGKVVGGRASLYARLLTPLAKVIQQRRGNGRVTGASTRYGTTAGNR